MQDSMFSKLDEIAERIKDVKRNKFMCECCNAELKYAYNLDVKFSGIFGLIVICPVCRAVVKLSELLNKECKCKDGCDKPKDKLVD